MSEPDDAPKRLRTTRAASARRQIEWAVKMLRAGEYDCAVALAATGEALVTDGLPRPHLSQLLGEFPGASLRQRHLGGGVDATAGSGPADHSRFDLEDWLRRSGETIEIEVTEFNAALVILRALMAYDAACGGPEDPFADFCTWAGTAYLELRAWSSPAG